jgi:hypothetical protein
MVQTEFVLRQLHANDGAAYATLVAIHGPTSVSADRLIYYA